MTAIVPNGQVDRLATGGSAGEDHARMHGRTLEVWENVKAHGAVGNGVVDDTAAIQNAIDALPSSGGTAFFPAGTYKLSSGITTGTTKPVHLMGAGMRATRITGTGFTLVSLESKRSVLSQMAISDSNASNDASTVAVQVGRSTAGMPTTHWKLDHVEIVGQNFTESDTVPTVGTGLKLLSALEGSIVDCVIKDWQTGILYAVNQAGNKSNANHIQGGAIRCCEYGIDIPSGTCNDAFVTGGVHEGGKTAIRNADSTQNLSVQTCHIESTQGVAVGIEMTTGVLYSIGTVYACTTTDILTSGAAGVRALGGAIGNTVHSGTGIFKMNGTQKTGTFTGTGPVWPDPVGTAPTYGTTVSIDHRVGDTYFINVTNGNAFTISNPDSPASTQLYGRTITIHITNASGGVMGAITWGNKYRYATWTNPAQDKRAAITFAYDPAYEVWVEVSRTPAETP